MKFILKKLLQYYLKYITKLILFIHRPFIIAIAGSTNKTFAKEAISKILKEEGRGVRSNPKSFNTEIGLPLAILNLPSGYHSYKNWLPIILKASLQIFTLRFPKILVLELGISNPGDMRYLLSVVKPKIAVITDITQRYIEGFGYMDELVKEYEYLVLSLGKSNLLVLNYDNIRVKNLAQKSRAKIEFFSIKNGHQFNNISLWQVVELKRDDNGQTIKISHDNIISSYKIHRFGAHHIYALLIALIIRKYVQKEEKI